MKLAKPDYFDPIQREAAENWEVLENKPQLAGPWHQLFRQVQNPRHVISELLQNADDAGASSVSVSIQEKVFQFSHNGKDFNRDEFASLCRFGYSNKRLLHTIGFRGIGFKSTFSLGEKVLLQTPTLDIAFDKKRFTFPTWIASEKDTDLSTTITVENVDPLPLKDIEKNIKEWIENPFSLLFFHQVRKIKLIDQELQWEKISEGPVENSYWVSLDGEDEKYLVISSQEEAFPDEAVNEINSERLLDEQVGLSIPPCKVEIILGAPGQIYIVLPTGVTTPLPYAINAPFMPDPARLKIKDPSLSPTNRWLLERVGKLAANTMLCWLNNPEIDKEERAKAYDLFPEKFQSHGRLEDSCTEIVQEAFLNELKEKPFILTEDGSLVHLGVSCNVAPELWQIWKPEKILAILNTFGGTPHLVCPQITPKNNHKLEEFNFLPRFETEHFVYRLVKINPPKPENWASLLKLWFTIANWLPYRLDPIRINVYPIRGEGTLFAAKETARLGEKKLLQSEKDWNFIAKYLKVIDTNWLRYLTEQRRKVKTDSQDELEKLLDAADRWLYQTKKHEPDDVDNVFVGISTEFFGRENIPLEECVHLAQIAAKLNVNNKSKFLFATQDCELREITAQLIFDETKIFERFIPPELRDEVLLHPDYSTEFSACSRDEWLDWINSGNSGVKKTLVPRIHSLSFNDKDRFEKAILDRGYSKEVEYQFKAYNFFINEWDFHFDYWNYWNECAKENPYFWCDLIEHFLRNSREQDYFQTPDAFQIAQTGTVRSLGIKFSTSDWVRKFRNLRCLRDTHGEPHLPADLMRRTPDTEPLLDVDPFIDARLDREVNYKFLDLLGVNTQPTGPDRILARLKALSSITDPPLLEVFKWYQKLDRLYDSSTTDNQQLIRKEFESASLIISDQGEWETALTISISAGDEDAPGAAVIHPDARSYSVWRKIGISEHPSRDLAIRWLMGLPSGEKLSPSDVRRVKSMLGRYGSQIWFVCKHWLNLTGEWVPVDTLRYSTSMQTMEKFTNLHEKVRTQTADLRPLTASVIGTPPFSDLLTLGRVIEKRVEPNLIRKSPYDISWLNKLGEILVRVDLEKDELNTKVHELASRLTYTKGYWVYTLRTTPYLDGQPAGLPENEDIAWIGTDLYIANILKPKIIRLLADLLCSTCDWADMKVITAYSFERKEAEILAYLQENYRLVIEDTNAAEAVSPIKSDGSTSPEPGVEVQSPETSTLPIRPIKDEADQEPVENDRTAGTEPKHRQPDPDRPARRPLVERFALTRGFHPNGDGAYMDDAGRMLIKVDGIFPWCVLDTNGSAFRYFYVREHCLDSKPLEIPVEVWNLLETNPANHALILEDFEGNPVEWTGELLLDKKNRELLKLYPAAYRMKLDLEE